MLMDARDQWLGLEIIWNWWSSLCIDSWNQQDLWQMTSTWMSESYKCARSLLVPVVFVTQFTVVRIWYWLAVLRGSVGHELLWHCIASTTTVTPVWSHCVYQVLKGVSSSKESVLWIQACRIRNNCMLLLEAMRVDRTDVYRNMVVSAGVEDKGKKAEKTGNVKISRGIWKQCRNSDLLGEETYGSWVKWHTDIHNLFKESYWSTGNSWEKDRYSFLRTKILAFVLGIAVSGCDRL